MNIREVNPPTPGQVADWSGVDELQRKMVQVVQALEAMADEVGRAAHVREYDSDRRKKALSRAMAAPLEGGESAAKAEALARADAVYSKELEQLAREHLAAEQTFSDWTAKKLVWETCRSLLSMQRETVKHL